MVYLFKDNKMISLVCLLLFYLNTFVPLAFGTAQREYLASQMSKRKEYLQKNTSMLKSNLEVNRKMNMNNLFTSII